MAGHKQISMYTTNTLPQCSPGSPQLNCGSVSCRQDNKKLSVPSYHMWGDERGGGGGKGGGRSEGEEKKQGENSKLNGLGTRLVGGEGEVREEGGERKRREREQRERR